MLAANTLNSAMNPPIEMPQDIRWMNAAAKWLGVALVALVVLAALAVLVRQPFFTVRKLTIEGQLQRNNLATVRANVLPRLDGGFFTQDLQRAKGIFETVPWVRRATVRRVWPNELRVTLEEHQPAAFWHHDDREDQLVNAQGDVFDANLGDVEDEPLPTLHGPTRASPDQARQMLDMLRRLAPVMSSLDSHISTVRLTDRGSWSVQLDDDALIELGRGDTNEIVARAIRFVKTLPQLRRQYPAKLAYADLRYAQGYAVRLKGLTTMSEISASQPEKSASMPLNSSKPD